MSIDNRFALDCGGEDRRDKPAGSLGMRFSAGNVRALRAALVAGIFSTIVFGAAVLAPAQPSPTKIFVDLQAQGNIPISQELNDRIYKADSLVELPQGKVDFGEGVEFQIGGKCVGVTGRFAPERPARIDGFKVNEKIGQLQILHACGWGAFGGKGSPHYQEDGTLIGYYRVNYGDGGREFVPIVYGRDVRDWWGIWDKFQPTTRSKVIWRGSNDHLRERPEARGIEHPLRLYLTVWSNPRPQAVVASIDLVSAKAVAAPFCVAITGVRTGPGAGVGAGGKVPRQPEKADLQKEARELRKQIEELERKSE